MCGRLWFLFPLWTGAVSGPGVKFVGAQVSVRELLVYSRNTFRALVRDPAAKPVVPLGMWSVALPVSFATSLSVQQVVCDAALGCAHGELVDDAVVVLSATLSGQQMRVLSTFL